MTLGRLFRLLAGTPRAGGAALAAISLVTHGEALAAVALPVTPRHPAIGAGLIVALGLLLRLFLITHVLLLSPPPLLMV